MTSILNQQSTALPSLPLQLSNVDKVVQSVTNATKRLSQISTNTNNSAKKRKAQNKIGPWKLGRTLGRGSTGRVRLAKNVRTGKLAAVKIVPKLNFKKLENPKYKNNDATRLPYGIEREIIIMKLISHPNIMGLYDVWENKNDLYLILEYIEGGELFDYLIKRGRLLEAEAINYFKQIIHGIGYLHQFNICHRDLKPENLLLDFNKNIKIADFGMAALEVDKKLLETSCGSPHYASPEIVAGKNYHGAPSDIWSCGIILFALLTGHLPFDDENIRKLLMKVQNGRFIMPSDLSWEAKDLISRMLQVNPNDRISIEDILTHPLLTKYPSPSDGEGNELSNLILHSNIKPIQSMDHIDAEIVRNLCILFHNCPEEQIIKCLLSPNKSPEKMFYYLLMKYRNEHSYSSGSYNYVDEDTDITPSGSKQTLPRSTSVIKTTVTTQTGEQLVTVQRVSRSTSSSSSTSTKNKTLSNITNSSFSASNAHKKKTLLKNTVISRKGSVNSFRNVKQKPLQHHSHTQNLPLKTEERKAILRKLTPGFIDLDAVTLADDKTSNNKDTREDYQHDEENKENEVRYEMDPSIMQFEKVCQDLFGSNVDTKSIYNLSLSLDKRNVSTETLNKLKLLNSRLSKTSLNLPKVPELPSGTPQRTLSKAERTEKKLAKEVQERNDARERTMREKEELSAKLIAEKKRQSQILQEKLREALRKINDIQSHRNSSAPLPSLVLSSLDPKSSVSPLLRARSLHQQSFPSKALNSKNSKVLQKLGIDFNSFSSPSSCRSSTLLKTSSSRNLANILSDDAHSTVRVEASILNEAEKLHELEAPSEDAASIASAKTKGSSYSLQNSKREPSRTNMTYRSMLDAIDERELKETSIILEGDSVNEEGDTTTNFAKASTDSNVGLIPNPRFSRITFNGLLNEPVATVSTHKERESKAASKKVTRQLLTTKKGKGLIEKASSNEFPGLGIKVPIVDESEQHDTSGDYSKNFVSIPSVEDTSSRLSSFQRAAISDENADDSSNDTLGEDFDLSKDLINMTNEYVSGNIDAPMSSSHVSKSRVLGREASGARKVSDKTSHGSRDTLVDDDRKDLILSMYKSYETLYTSRTNAHEHENDELRTSFNADIANAGVLDTSSLSENTHLSYESQNIFMVDDSEPKKQKKKKVDDDADETGEDLIVDDHNHESVGIEKQGTIKSSLRRSHASTQIFSTMKMSEKINTAEINSPNPSVVRHEKSKPVVDEEKPNVFRRISLKPKREAPKAPEVQVWDEEKLKGHNRFSGISVRSNAKKFIAPRDKDSPSVGGWFRKFFQSFTRGNRNDVREADAKSSRRDVYIIETSVVAHDLMRIIRNQMKMKEIEGSVSHVEIDEEFALISGVIPSKFARGRKLHFKIEIIDLVNSSSLHLLKIKGSRTGFKNLIEVVSFVIKQEEEANDLRRSSGYKFDGHKA